MEDMKATTEAHARQLERDARSLLEQGRLQRQREDLEQKASIDQLYLRTRAAATMMKERAEADFAMQHTLRQRYMDETDDLLSKSRAELEEVVRKSEHVVCRAEERLNVIKADSRTQLLRAASLKTQMIGIVHEAEGAAAAACSEVHDIKSALHAQCSAPIQDLLRTVAAAHEVLSAIGAEQDTLLSTHSRGLEVEASSAMRHALHKNEMRKHIVNWTLNVHKCVPLAPPTIPNKLAFSFSPGYGARCL